MQKPSTVAYRDFIASLNKLISESELPAFVLVPTLQSITAQLTQIEQQQYLADKAEYERQLQTNARQPTSKSPVKEDEQS